MGILSMLAILTTMNTAPIQDPPYEPLWPGGAPGAKGTATTDIPAIQVFKADPAKATHAAIIVCPGGAYAGLAGHEGAPIAKWLQSLGITAAVLRYRLGTQGYRHPIMLGDAQRAIRTLRFRAKDLDVDVNKVGILGFSAGGHLTSTAATHFDDGNPSASDPIDRMGCRPDVAIPCYAVISMEPPYGHDYSRKMLLGDNPDPALVQLLCNEKQVTPKTSPSFLWYTGDDPVHMENALLYAIACRKNGVPVEVHVFEKGAHGLGLAEKDPAVGQWTKLCEVWLRGRGFVK